MQVPVWGMESYSPWCRDGGASHDLRVTETAGLAAGAAGLQACLCQCSGAS